MHTNFDIFQGKQVIFRVVKSGDQLNLLLFHIYTEKQKQRHKSRKQKPWLNCYYSCIKWKSWTKVERKCKAYKLDIYWPTYSGHVRQISRRYVLDVMSKVRNCSSVPKPSMSKWRTVTSCPSDIRQSWTENWRQLLQEKTRIQKVKKNEHIS